MQISLSELLDRNFDSAPQLTELINLLDLSDSRRFDSLLRMGISIGERHELTARLIAGYTDMPSGCDQSWVLNFAEYSEKSGRAKHDTWKFRIVFHDKETHTVNVVLPTWHLTNHLDRSAYKTGRRKNYSPISIDDFLEHPFKYCDIL